MTNSETDLIREQSGLEKIVLVRLSDQTITSGLVRVEDAEKIVAEVKEMRVW